MLEVRYKCKCFDSEGKAQAQGQEILDWMTEVQWAIASDHKARAPDCRLGSMEYAKIPAYHENSPFLGARPELH